MSQLRNLNPVPNDYQYTGLRIDAALRHFLEHVNLVGESSERARILKHFADRYYECNPTLFDGTGIFSIRRSCNHLKFRLYSCIVLRASTTEHGFTWKCNVLDGIG